MNIILEEKETLKYIKEILNRIKKGTITINNARYHHNTHYQNAPSICKHGILTLADLNKITNQIHSQEDLKRLNDTESHINGTNAISLSVVGLTDLYRDEFEYDPYNPEEIDFLISSEIKAARTTTNYGNEFLSHQSLTLDKIKAIDIRLLELIEITKESNQKEYYTIKRLIEKYNFLRKIAMILKENNLNIPIREMSFKDNSIINIDELISTPKIILKKS